MGDIGSPTHPHCSPTSPLSHVLSLKTWEEMIFERIEERWSISQKNKKRRKERENKTKKKGRKKRREEERRFKEFDVDRTIKL